MLTPPTQTHHVNEFASITATLTNSCNIGLSGALVYFKVVNGVNAGLIGSGVTDFNGQAEFSYSSSASGTDTWQAATFNPAGAIASTRWQSSGGGLTSMTGRAYGVSATAKTGILTINLPPTPDTGPVDTMNAQTVAPPCVASVNKIVLATHPVRERGRR